MATASCCGGLCSPTTTPRSSSRTCSARSASTTTASPSTAQRALRARGTECVARTHGFLRAWPTAAAPASQSAGRSRASSRAVDSCVLRYPHLYGSYLPHQDLPLHRRAHQRPRFPLGACFFFRLPDPARPSWFHRKPSGRAGGRPRGLQIRVVASAAACCRPARLHA
jgi:hypothetical protein